MQVGTKLGAYEIFAKIGEGGMGEVHRARDARLNRDVAIKVVPPSVAGNPEALARFERESHAIAALSHPNILTIFDVGHSNGHPYAVMELLEGETLRARNAVASAQVVQAHDAGPIPGSVAGSLALCHRGVDGSARDRAAARRDPPCACGGSAGGHRHRGARGRKRVSTRGHAHVRA